MRHFQRRELCKSTKNNARKLLILTKNHNVRAGRTRKVLVITTRPRVRNRYSHNKKLPPAARPGRTVHSSRSPRSRAPARADQRGAAADPRQDAGAAVRCRLDQSPTPGAGSPQRPRRALPFLLTIPRAGCRQDTRSAPRAHRAQLPEPSIMGPARHNLQTNHKRAFDTLTTFKLTAIMQMSSRI